MKKALNTTLFLQRECPYLTLGHVLAGALRGMYTGLIIVVIAFNSKDSTKSFI